MFLRIFAFHGSRPPSAVTPLVSCAFCGRDNEPMSRFCIDCGKPISASAARVVPAYQPGAPPTPVAAVVPPTRVAQTPNTCPKCAKAVEPDLPFCGHCGTLVKQRVSIELNRALDNAFGTMVIGAKSREVGPRLALLSETGDVSSTFTLDRGEAVVGRGDADIRFDDVYLSPLHARFELRDGELWVRDLGSRNGTWTFIDAPTRLTDCDVILVGSQLLRFRRLGYPGPHPPEADSTRRMGSLVPSADVAVLEQLRADGRVRDTFHLSPARTIMLGREAGDWVFPYDPTMSGRHAEIRSQDAEFFVHDAGSRNGVAIGVRGERTVKKAQRILVGDQVLRVESLGL